MTDLPATERSATQRPYADVLADAIRLLTEAGRGLDRGDFAEFLTLAVAGAAANVGGVEALLAGRPGSWEADYVRNMLHSTVGHDEQGLLRHRTEPLRITVHVENILDDIGYNALYDAAQQEIFRRHDAVAVDEDNVVTEEGEAQLDALAELEEQLNQLRDSEIAAYGEAFKANIVAAAADEYPDIASAIEVEVVTRWEREPPMYAWGSPEERLLELAQQRTPLPGSGIALQDYPPGDIATTERAAGRDPLSRIANR